MSGSVKQGASTTETDLPISFDRQGCLTDPYSVTFSFFDCTDCASVTPELIGASRRIPVKIGVGKYYPPITIDADEPVGKHFIRWYWKESANDVEKTIDREFDVIPSQAITGQQYPDRIKSLIYELRKKLRDINPDRDYSFSPPTSDIGISGFTKCRGYRWPDEQLANHLMQAVNYINIYAPISCFDLCDLPCLLEDLVLRQAVVYALFDMASLWVHEEFQYSLNGINLDISRSDKYLNMANQLQDQNNALLERSKLPLMRSTKGLKQSPYTFSRGAALGPLTSGINLKRFVR
jgi:hypothetical protein